MRCRINVKQLPRGRPFAPGSNENFLFSYVLRQLKYDTTELISVYNLGEQKARAMHSFPIFGYGHRFGRSS